MGSVQEAQDMIAKNNELSYSNILTVGESDATGASSKIYSGVGDGNTGFMNVYKSADPHEFGHLLGLSDRYDYFGIEGNYEKGTGKNKRFSFTTGSAARYLTKEYDPEYYKDPKNNLMSLRNADGVLTNMQLNFIFSHGNFVIPKTESHSENLAIPTMYFFKGGGPPGILGKPGVNNGQGSYSPTNGVTGDGASFYRKYTQEVQQLYRR